ncbi:MAG: serine hydrolase domain-containing protein, partial [Sphingomicrobium sp.]
MTRRGFAGGALGLALGAPFAGRIGAAPNPGAFDAAIAAIAAYAQRHLRHFNLPGLTLGLTVPGGPQLARHFGVAEAGARTPITDETLFQVGSISKLMSAALVHQYATAGRIRLSDRISDLVPEIPLPKEAGITVQQLLDHVSGLPGDAPLFSPGGLWIGFKPGSQWSYSNTGYDVLGKLIEHLGGKPLARQLSERLFAPLGMTRTYGAITADQRSRFAQGYEAADNIAPYVRGTPLAPAAWVDVTFAAGSVASTASDMNILMRSIADAAQGRGGLGLSPKAGLEFARHMVATDTSGMHYGNGLMHVGSGGHSYLHHTGGMVSFSSSFHV